ncbi:MAG: hypothetical protein WED34_17875 [Planctomycetales bacterium]
MPNRSLPWLFCSCGCLAAAAIGCAAPDYGNYGYPGYAVPSGGAVYPGGTYPPPPALGAPTIGPAMTLPPTAAPYPQPIEGGDAPRFDPNRDLGPQPGTNLVPDPRDPRDARGTRDPGDLQPPPGARRPPRDDDGLQSPFGGAASRSEPVEEPLARVDSSPAADLGGASVAEDDFFQPPIMNPGSAGRPRVAATTVSDQAELDPFGHDQEGHTWLKGQVDYDPASDTWHIIYSAKGDEDEFGGAMLLTTLPEGTKLEDGAMLLPTLRDGAKIEDGAIVLIQGGVDHEQLDRNGKATYRARSIRPLQPRRRADAAKTAEAGHVLERDGH